MSRRYHPDSSNKNAYARSSIAGSGVRPLHLAANIEELNEQVDRQFPKIRKEKLEPCAETCFRQAEDKLRNGYEESAYILYMRFIRLIKNIKSNYDAEKVPERKQFTGKIDATKIQEAIVRCEELSKRLEQRYEEKNATSKPIEKAPEEPAADKKNVSTLQITNGMELDKDFMTCQQLNSLWTKKTDSFLVIDIRPSDDFKSSSMKFSNLVSIPEETLRKGLTANACGDGMSPNHKDLWSRRFKYDYLIICDERSEVLPLSAFIGMIMDAIEKWDGARKYNCGHPLVLKGGFDLFRLTYPYLVSNPLYEPSSTRPTPQIDSLSLNIEYPDLDTGFLEAPKKDNTPPKVLPPINRETKPSVARPPPKSVKNTNIDAVAETVKKLSEPKTEELMTILSMKVQLVSQQVDLLQKIFKTEQAALEKLKELEKVHQKEGEDTQAQRIKLELQIADGLTNRKKLDDEYQNLRKFDEQQNLLHQVSMYTDFKPSNEQEAAKLNNFKKEKLMKMNNMEEMRIELVKEVEGKKAERMAQEQRLKKLEAERQRLLIKDKENRPPSHSNQSSSSIHSSQRIRPSPNVTDGSTPESYTTKLRSSPRTSPVRGGTKLRRSHSALNISQLHEENTESPSMPAFDRTLKPLESPRRRSVNVAKHRNFEPKYGNPGRGRTGLKNLGNTCYMNSIVQCLNNTIPLMTYFWEDQYSDHINEKSRQKGDIAVEAGAVIKALWSGQYKSISLWDFKNAVGRYYRPFSGTDQQDSHELLIKLIDWLHEDLNLADMRRTPMEEQNFDSVPDYVAAQKFLSEIEKRDHSIVSSVMHGLHRSVITCGTCTHRSLTFETFSVLTFSFVSSGKCSLNEMINAYYKETSIEYNCARCKTSRKCRRKMDIWKLPPILIVHLNRFEHDVLMKKNQNYVDFPLEGLNMSPYCGSNVVSHDVYNLYAVSNHYGTMDGGHYTAFCKQTSTNKWLKYDDNEVYEHSRHDVKSSAAYILFYQTVNHI